MLCRSVVCSGAMPGRSKKKREKELEKQKEAARKAMEDAGIDLSGGGSAGTARKQVTASKAQKAEEAARAKAERVTDVADAALDKGGRKTGDMKRKVNSVKNKVGGKLEVSEEEAARREKSYEPWRTATKSTKEDWN
eukprot:COSAG01_NODE_31302_length_600_cov_0.784431_1_plen_136_part_10